jgi:uncharacterized glyoxalase superfamily protein PhnB
MAAGGMQRAAQEQVPTMSTPATAMRYRDVAAAADWLCTAFGFEEQTALTDDTGRTLYAQLTFGRALLMLAPVGDSPIEQFMKQPDEVGGAETQSTYFLVSDADAHHDRARAAGAEIVLPVEDDDFGGRGYTCRDPEGHLWTFGTYDPWQGRFPAATVAMPAAPVGGRRLMLGSLTAVALVAVGVAAWFGGAQSSAGSSTPALEAAEQAARDFGTLLGREREARAAADKSSEEALKRAAEAQQGLESAERAVKQVRAELEKERTRKVAAQTPPPELLKRVEEESRARETAERTAREARAELERERTRKAADTPPPELLKRVEEESRARQAAERAAKEARAELEQERARRTTLTAAQTPAADAAKRSDEAAERAVKEARSELDKARADKAAAEMAKEFALGRAEEEQAAREAAERAVEEARAELQRLKKTAAGPAASAGATDDKKAASGDNNQKALASLQKALEKAQKLGAEEKRAREDAERAVEQAREEAARERTAKNAAWKTIVQLRRQTSQSGQSDASNSSSTTASSSTTTEDDPPPKRPRKAKKSDPE